MCGHICMRSDSCVSAALFFTLSDLTWVSRRTGLCCGTSLNCQKKLIKVLKFLVRLHTQECEEQGLHGGGGGCLVKKSPLFPGISAVAQPHPCGADPLTAPHNSLMDSHISLKGCFRCFLLHRHLILHFGSRLNIECSETRNNSM